MVFLKIFQLFFLEDFYLFLDFWFYHLPKNLFRQVVDLIYLSQHDFGFKKNFRHLFRPFYFFPLRLLYLIILSLGYTLFFFLSSLVILSLIFLPVALLILSLPKNEILLGK